MPNNQVNTKQHMEVEVQERQMEGKVRYWGAFLKPSNYQVPQ